MDFFSPFEIQGVWKIPYLYEQRYKVTSQPGKCSSSVPLQSKVEVLMRYGLWAEAGHLLAGTDLAGTATRVS